MGARMMRSLCRGEVQRGEALQEFRSCIEMETDPVAAEICRERSKAVRLAGRICDIQPNREL